MRKKLVKNVITLIMCNNVIFILYRRINTIFTMFKRNPKCLQRWGEKKSTFMLWELASRRQPWTYFSTTVTDLACTPQLSYSAWTWTVLGEHLAHFHSCFLWRIDGGKKKNKPTHASETLHIYRASYSVEDHVSSAEFNTPALTCLRAGQLSLELHARPSLSTCLLRGTPPASSPKDQASYQKDPFSLVLYGD